MNKYATYMALGILFDLATTFYGFAEGFVEGNVFGNLAIYGSFVMAFIVLTLFQTKLATKVTHKFRILQWGYISAGTIRFAVGIRNILLVQGFI